MSSTPAATILIVDDETRNRELLEMSLQSKGYATVSADSGEAALRCVEQEAPDLILLDVMMPDMDGNQVAIRLKSNPVTADIPIIMLTALADHAARLAGLGAGAEEFLSKPVDLAELWLRGRNLLRLKEFNESLKNQSWILEQEVQKRTADLQHFRSAMDATADAIFLVNRGTMRYVEVNAAACQLLGYTREELLELSPTALLGMTLEELADAYDDTIAGHALRRPLETQLRCKDGSNIQVEVQRQAQRFGADWTIVGIARDITVRKEAEQRLHHMAHYDALTGLPNRMLFYETLHKTLSVAKDGGASVAVLRIDLDQFKTVNDSLGHATGDELLGQFGGRLAQCVRVRDTVGRLGGDEFGLILLMQDGLAAGTQSATLVANAIREILRTPFQLNGHARMVTVSMGISVYPDDASDIEALVRHADTAMYRAKQAGRDTFRFFTAQMNADVLVRLDLEAALRRAIENDEFVLYYQPKVQLSSGRIAGLEALLRWQRPGYGLVSPQEFIPVLEESGLILRVGRWVIATACQQIGRWMRSDVGPLQVSVNVSGRQFLEGDLEADVILALADSGIPADLLELELTESSLMANTQRTISTLQALKLRGVQISIDDFGTGYSSLAYLRRFPIDKLKIDIAFIREVTTSPGDAAIALAIISMAHSLKLDVIAEGVETEAQLSYLRRNRCDQMQGFFFSRPLPVAELERLVCEDKRLPPPSGQGRGPRSTLLVVDDEARVLTALQRQLRPDGYHILSAQSAAEGFELLALHPVQVILCDQRMPNMSGTQFLDRVKDLYPDTFRIVLSGYADLESIMDAINRGAVYRFYTKPWDNKALRKNVSEAFRHYWLLHTIPDDAMDTESAAVGGTNVISLPARP